MNTIIKAIRRALARAYDDTLRPVPAGMICTECKKAPATFRLTAKHCACNDCFVDVNAV